MVFEETGVHRYHKKGSNPKLVILSGTHGDEYHVIEPLIELVQAEYSILPDFLFIPEVSPSAVDNRSRKNKFGHDINRGFGKLVDDEILTLKKLFTSLTDGVVVSFHEDLENQQFYFYDTSSLGETLLEDFRASVRKLEVPLFSGIDDPTDPALSYEIKDGYIDLVGVADENGPFIEDWAMFGGNFSRFFTFEIPYKHEKLPELLHTCIQLALKLV